jgi:2-dehydro-3-deoxygluconokinase
MGQRLVTFGEVMGRITPVGALRFAQSFPGAVNYAYGGGEVNVAVAVASLGGSASFVTALPRNPPADGCIRTLRGLGVGVDDIVRTSHGRLGLYYLEPGANQRASVVTYDRDGAAVALAEPSVYDWPRIFAGASWFHVTGITPAISRQAAQAALEAVRNAHECGVSVSCDLNFRKKLWNWEPGIKARDLAERTMRRLLEHVDLVIANEEDGEMVLGIKAAGADVEAGKLDARTYAEVARTICSQFGGVSRVAVTLRESVSADHNNWGGMLYDRASDRCYFAPLDADGAYCPYEIRDIVDRVGGGDSFAGGLLYALMDEALCDPQTAIRFAVANSCLKHSILGDFNFVSRAEVEALMGGSGTGRVVR